MFSVVVDDGVFGECFLSLAVLCHPYVAVMVLRTVALRGVLQHEVMTNYQVVIAAGSHLFPFRTEKLSPLAPMVLQCNVGE